MEAVKGFKDYTGEIALKRDAIKEIIKGIFKKYGFEPAETPIIEYEEFVKGNNTEDEVISDIYRLEDKGKRKLALRYEFTFQLKRIADNKKLPYKRFQIGEVFRDEPVNSNRARQFVQCDVDIVGSSVKDEAEILALTSDIFNALKIDFKIKINNRKLINEILEEERVKDKENVIREIDKLDKLSEKEIRENLKKYGAEKILSIIKKPESYFKKYKNYDELLELKKYCTFYGIKVEFQPGLTRGLSYYNGSVFEVKTNAMKETIAAGGSYLVNNIQSTGISFGLDRISNTTNLKIEPIKCLVVSINKDKEAIDVLNKLRREVSTIIMYDKISKSLDYANKLNIPYVIFVGEKEIKSKNLKLRDMNSGRERLLSLKECIKYLNKK